MAGRILRRRRLTYRITSSRERAQVREVIRDHLSSPLGLLWWNFGIKPRDQVIGLLIGNRFYARPVPFEMPVGRYTDSLVIRGRVKVNSNNNVCEVDVRAWPSRIKRVLVPGILVLVGCVYLLIIIATGIVGLLIGIGVLMFMGAINALVLHVHRGSEASEIRLLEQWVDAVAKDLGGVATASACPQLAGERQRPAKP